MGQGDKDSPETSWDKVTNFFLDLKWWQWLLLACIPLCLCLIIIAALYLRTSHRAQSESVQRDNVRHLEEQSVLTDLTLSDIRDYADNEERDLEKRNMMHLNALADFTQSDITDYVDNEERNLEKWNLTHLAHKKVDSKHSKKHLVDKETLSKREIKQWLNKKRLCGDSSSDPSSTPDRSKRYMKTIRRQRQLIEILQANPTEQQIIGLSNEDKKALMHLEGMTRKNEDESGKFKHPLHGGSSSDSSSSSNRSARYMKTIREQRQLIETLQARLTEQKQLTGLSHEVNDALLHLEGMSRKNKQESEKLKRLLHVGSSSDSSSSSDRSARYLKTIREQRQLIEILQGQLAKQKANQHKKKERKKKN